jgi:catechol 2,3-dioxygenase-like lactoylglutathione lyase family enzyme
VFVAERAKPAYRSQLEACMLNLENLKKQAKLLVRWHRERNYSVGERIRVLPRYQELTDIEALALKFPLSEAQEVIATEAGYESWAALKSGLSANHESVERQAAGSAVPQLKTALPVVFVSNVQASAAFFRDKLGFAIDFLHGYPAFYGSVSRGGARVHLRFVHEPAIVLQVREREKLLSAILEVANIKSLFAEYKAAGVGFAQPLRKEPWGASSFIVSDPDGNSIYFSG